MRLLCPERDAVVRCVRGGGGLLGHFLLGSGVVLGSAGLPKAIFLVF